MEGSLRCEFDRIKLPGFTTMNAGMAAGRTSNLRVGVSSAVGNSTVGRKGSGLVLIN